MIISHTSSLLIFRIFGGLTALSYAMAVSSNAELTERLNGSDLAFHLIVWLVMTLLITLSWVMKLSSGKLESVWGCLLFKRRKVFTDLLSLEFLTSYSQGREKGNSYSLSLGIKVRSQAKPIVLYSGLNEEEGRLLCRYGKQVLAATGKLPVNISKSFGEIYKSQYGEDFTF